MKPVIIDRRARRELDKAMARYEKRRTGLGVDLQTEIEMVAAKIQQNPLLGSPYKITEYRFWRVRRFPFVVYYVNLSDSIWIAAFAHNRRRPDYWRHRRRK